MKLIALMQAVYNTNSYLHFVKHFYVDYVQHEFEVILERIQGSVMNDTLWGETDCFVQYHFPNQDIEYGSYGIKTRKYKILHT